LLLLLFPLCAVMLMLLHIVAVVVTIVFVSAC
jgi:hypothetical protein